MVGPRGWISEYRESAARRRASDSRDPYRRRSDRRLFLVDILIIVLIGAMSVWVDSVARNVGKEASKRSDQRTLDLRASCRRTSVKTAADVNLNWLYYMSEQDLAAPGKPSAEALAALDQLPVAQRNALILLASSGGQSRKVLEARAQADFNAAFTKARTVDYRDAKYVNVVTPLGASPTPRLWVLRAHYSCDKAFDS